MEEKKLCHIFKWRDRKGNFHAPRDMETHHLFFTLRMIWNHSAPEELKILPYKKYAFSSFYTPQYVREAVRYLCRELSLRTDLTPYFRRCLVHMQSVLENRRTVDGGI